MGVVVGNYGIVNNDGTLLDHRHPHHGFSFLLVGGRVMAAELLTFHPILTF